MSWIAITVESLETALSGPEYVAYTGKALRDGQASPTPEQIRRVSKYVRGYVAACNKNRLGAGLTIPEELENAAVAIVAWELATRLPLTAALMDRLEKKKNDALELLQQTARCDFAIEQPPIGEESAEEIPGAGSPRITPRRRHWTRRQQDGI